MQLFLPQLLLALQVWDQTPELKPFKNRRFSLTLNDETLVATLRQLAEQALQEDNAASASAAQQEQRLHAAFFSKAVAFDLVKRLPSRKCGKDRVQTVPLVQKKSQLETLQAWQYDPDVLPVLPPQLQARLQKEGRIVAQTPFSFSQFWPMDFANAQALRRAAGASPGIYQIFLCKYSTQDDGTCELVMRTEWYVGAASVGKSLADLLLTFFACTALPFVCCAGNTTLIALSYAFACCAFSMLCLVHLAKLSLPCC